MTTRKVIFWLLSLDIVVILSVLFVFGIRYVDTADYVGQIENFRHLTFYSPLPWIELRDFKPLIGALGMALPFISPIPLLLMTDAVFFAGLSILLFYFFDELGFTKEKSFLGATWIVATYPGVAYGFSGGTDVLGWFFCLATIVAALAAFRANNNRLLLLASLLGFLGSTSKETGVLGMLFAGVYILLHVRAWGFAKMVKKLLILCVPFVILYGALMYMFYRAGIPSFIGWFIYAENLYASVHTLKFFVGAEFATFNILWVFIAVGLYALARSKILLSKERWCQFIALFIAALPVIEWPFFTDRILYIEFIILIPLALYGVTYIEQDYKPQPWVRYSLYALPILCGIFFLIIGGHDGLYTLIHQLHRR